ncbi:MAG: hypothetical protein QOF50_1274, partial [Gaiellaceae bacterium]|nr:hypothetical protein [Gaiellaceae bacterium]
RARACASAWTGAASASSPSSAAPTIDGTPVERTITSGASSRKPDSTGVPSIVGAALLGLDALAAPVQADAHARAREELSRAVNELESAPAGAGMRRDDG